MSKLLGTGPLTMGNLVQGKPPAEGMTSHARTYICRSCGKSFSHYKGVKFWPGGLGLCKEHNPSHKPE